ncbi:MAG TPA: hypothetical protein VLW54_04560 [Candidatus Acidoferrales bacterium]|nr:hypothetical protein [Candidatus Acidoferrales bacterium]
MKRIQLRRPKIWSPAEYAKHFRQGQQSLRQAAGLSSTQTGTGAPSPASHSDTGLALRSSPSADGATSSTSSISSTSSTYTDNRCSFTSTDGRRCRMLRDPAHPDLCYHHAERELRSLAPGELEPLAAEILGPIRDFRSAAAINVALGNLFVQLADGRLDVRRAAVLTYIAQSIQHTVKSLAMESVDSDPNPGLRAALSAILRTAKPRCRSDKCIHNALSAVVAQHTGAAKSADQASVTPVTDLTRG